MRNPGKMDIMLKLRNKVLLPKKELFEHKIKWTHLKKKEIFDVKVKKWLLAKSIEIFTLEEMSFVNLVLKLLEE